MKNTLIFAGLMVFMTTGVVSAFDSDPRNAANAQNAYPEFDGTYANVTTDNNAQPAGTYEYAAKREADGNVRIRVATTNYVANAVGSVVSQVNTLGTDASTDSDVVVGSDGTGGLKAELQTMGGSTCGVGGACTTENATSKLNAPTYATGVTAASYASSNCGGQVGNYDVSACGFIKGTTGTKQWIKIIGDVHTAN